MEEYKIHRFHELPGTNQDKILELLRCAVLDPENHLIRAQPSGVKARPYGYRVQLPEHNPSCTQVTADWDLRNWLMHNGFVEHGDVPWKTFRFYAEVIAWYRETHPLSEAEERKLIGRYYYALATSDDDLEPFDTARVAEKTGLSVDRILQIHRALVGAGILYNDGPGGAGVPNFYKLTRPKGFNWAIGGYRADLGGETHVEVNLTVNFDLDRVIQAIERLGASEDQKRFYELSVTKLERELKRGRVNWDTVKDALSTAADVKEVAVPILTLVGSNLDQIAEAAGQLPIP